MRTLTDAVTALNAGTTSSVQLVEQSLRAAERHDSALGVFISTAPDRALRAAETADRQRAAGDRRPLLGIPIGVKDVLTVPGFPTTCQSLVEDLPAVAAESTAVRRLRSAGAVVVGKTTTMEFSYGAPDPAKPFPVPRNPWDAQRWAGGSSSGSASGVASGMMLGALGSDTGASIRMPAAHCGITGLKPTFGRVPTTGCVPLSPSLDHVGPMAASARDCALLLAAVAGRDADDPTSAGRSVPDHPHALDGEVAGLRIGVAFLDDFAPPDADPAARALLAQVSETFTELGARVLPVELPWYAEAAAAQSVILLAEAFALHEETLNSRWSDYAEATRLGLAGGLFLGAADYVQALAVQRVVRRAVAELFRSVDLVLTPTAPVPAPRIGAIGAYMGSAIHGRGFTFHTGYWNLAGNPALSLPMGFSAGGLPLGAQLIGRWFDELTVLRAGDAYQRATRWFEDLPEPALAADPRDLERPASAPAGVPDAQDLALTRSAQLMFGLTRSAVEAERIAHRLPVVRATVRRLRPLGSLASRQHANGKGDVDVRL